MKMVIYRPEKLDYTKMDIDLLKKPGKGLGLSIIAKKSGKGVYISDIVSVLFHIFPNLNRTLNFS